MCKGMGLGRGVWGWEIGFCGLWVAGKWRGWIACLVFWGVGFWLDGGVFRGFRGFAGLMLPASFSRAEKEGPVGGLTFELEAGAGLAHGYGPWERLGGGLPAGVKGFACF